MLFTNATHPCYDDSVKYTKKYTNIKEIKTKKAWSVQIYYIGVMLPDKIWHEMTWNDILDMIWHMTLHDIYDIRWHDMTWHAWHDIHDMTWHDIYDITYMTLHGMTWHDIT